MFNEEFSDFTDRLEPIDFERLPGYRLEGLADAWNAFQRTNDVFRRGIEILRPGRKAPKFLAQFLSQLSEIGLSSNDRHAAELFHQFFEPHRVKSESQPFFTGYYEPEVPGSLVRTLEFQEPLLARPADLETFSVQCSPFSERFSAGRRRANGEMEPYPTRGDIENSFGAGFEPIVWVRDAAEAFKIHLQGSGRVQLPNGEILRLTYAGRNGRPYSSLGKKLIERGLIAPSDMSPERIYEWIRRNGQGLGEPGRRLMQENESYIFFSINRQLEPNLGPIGAASVPLTPFRSIAVDRNLWPYGLPYWLSVSSDLAWDPQFKQMMIGQDTGSAILGLARADLYCGTGDEAGRLAGQIHHSGDFFVLLPRSPP